MGQTSRKQKNAVGQDCPLSEVNAGESYGVTPPAYRERSWRATNLIQPKPLAQAKERLALKAFRLAPAR